MSVYVDKKRVFISDLEQVKKNEQLRRRKLRLQQVREQSRYLANQLRQKGDENKNVKQKTEESDFQIHKLNIECKNCQCFLSDTRKNVEIENEADKLRQEQQRLLDELAKVRGSLANQRVQFEKVSRQKSTEKRVHSTVTKKDEQSQATAKKSPTKKLLHDNGKDKVDDNFEVLVENLTSQSDQSINSGHESLKICRKIGNSDETKAAQSLNKSINPLSKFTSYKDWKSQRRVHTKIDVTNPFRQNVALRKRSISECDESISDESFCSDITWPPSRRNVSTRVTLYDHNGRSVQEYPAPRKIVTSIKKDSQSKQEMSNRLAEEEAKEAKIAEENAASIRTCQRRGCRALYKQKLQSEFLLMLRDLSRLDKQKRIEVCNTITNKKQVANQPCCSKNKDRKTSISSEIEQVIPEVSPEDFYSEVNTNEKEEKDLRTLLSKLKEQRKALLERSSCDENEILNHSEIIEIPEWVVHAPVRALGSNRLSEANNFDDNDSICSNDYSPNSVSTPKKPDKKSIEVEKPKTSKSKEDNGKCLTSESSVSVEMSKMCVERSTETSDSTTTTSFDGIQVLIKICSRTNTPKKSKSSKSVSTKSIPMKQIETQTSDVDLSANTELNERVDSKKCNMNESWERKLSSSDETSYRSPPNTLTVSQRQLLNSILLRIDSQNKNPVLRSYILRLLAMSHENVEELGVSSSDVTLQSDLVREMKKNEQINQQQDYCDEYVQTMTRTDVSCSTDEKTPILKRVITRIPSDTSDQQSFSQSDYDECVKLQEENLQYSELANQYAERVNELTHIIHNLKFNRLYNHAKSQSPTDESTKYYDLPSEINISTKISDSVRRLAEQKGFTKYNQTFNSDTESELTGNNLGVRTELLPKPTDIYAGDNDVKKKIRKPPPAVLQKNINRKNVPEAIAHELSSIAEADSMALLESKSRILINEQFKESSNKCQAKPSNRSHSSQMEYPDKRQLYDINENENNLLDESSLSLVSGVTLSDFDDRLSAASSDDNLEDVFHSLGIGWAAATLRKLKEAKQLSSSPSDNEMIRKEKSKSPSNQMDTFRHSTPVKNRNEIPDIQSTSDGNSLTPPDLSLQRRYLKLIGDIN